MSEIAGKQKRRVQAGDQAVVELPFSEVCMHMRVAGQIRRIELVGTGPTVHYKVMVQVFDARDRLCGPPITPGEAGVYRDEQGFYIYEPDLVAVP